MQFVAIRILDLCLSLIGILLGCPIMLIIYLVNTVDIKSPLFFQQRLGKDQERFTLAKFRTMPVDTQSVGTHLMDARSISPFGKFLRKSKLDELPQLYNVLLGQMSLVGPRPCLVNQAELISERNKRNIFNVRPGLTGIAQLNDIDMSTPRKLARYDVLMINRMTVKLYLQLVYFTVLGKGRDDRIKTNN